jgi:hypothetical protein
MFQLRQCTEAVQKEAIVGSKKFSSVINMAISGTLLVVPISIFRTHFFEPVTEPFVCNPIGINFKDPID